MPLGALKGCPRRVCRNAPNPFSDLGTHQATWVGTTAILSWLINVVRRQNEHEQK